MTSELDSMGAFRGSAMAADVNHAKRRATASARSGGRSLTVVSPPDRVRVFAAARRRSLRVRFLRVAILVGGLGTVAALVGIAIFNPFAAKLGALSFSKLAVEGTKITMVRPKLAGFRSDGQPYEFTAERALQDVKDPTVLKLETVDGEIGKAEGVATHISADAGVYDSAREHMELSSNVRIGSARFEVRLRSADIDFKTGVYRSQEPIEVDVGKGTTLFGDRATARNNGQELIFEGHVRTRITPETDTAQGDDANRNNR
jgi:lipopolysaccharide export system protein LptC